MDYNISEEDKNRWRKDRWAKDNVLEILKKDGFTLKFDGRSGFIYYAEDNNLIEFYVEMSGVPEYDLLIYFDEEIEKYPNKKILDQTEKIKLKAALMEWLSKKGIKSDL